MQTISASRQEIAAEGGGREDGRRGPILWISRNPGIKLILHRLHAGSTRNRGRFRVCSLLSRFSNLPKPNTFQKQQKKSSGAADLSFCLVFSVAPLLPTFSCEKRRRTQNSEIVERKGTGTFGDIRRNPGAAHTEKVQMLLKLGRESDLAFLGRGLRIK